MIQIRIALKWNEMDWIEKYFKAWVEYWEKKRQRVFMKKAKEMKSKNCRGGV